MPLAGMMLRWLRRLLYRSGAKVTVTIPTGFQEGDALELPDGRLVEWVDGHFRPMKPADPDRQ